MSEAPLPTPAGSVADPPVRPAPWFWPAVVAVAFSPFVLTAVGLAAAALLHPARPAAPPIVAEVPPAVVAPEPTAPAQPEPVEPGEARPPIPGLSPPVAEPGPEAPTPEPVPVAAVRGPKCEKYGTAVNFVRSPALACDRAARDQKLAMILHVAGHFDDPGFT